MFGEERLIEAFTHHAGMCARDIIHGILDSVYRFTDYSIQDDDMTLVCIRKV